MKKLRAAAMIAVATTAVTKAKDYAREHPDQAGQARQGRGVHPLQGPAQAHRLHRQRAPGLRQGLGLPARSAAGTGWDDQDPDPDTSEQWPAHRPSDPLAPNPAPGTSDDPQPRHHVDDPGPMTPGEYSRR